MLNFGSINSTSLVKKVSKTCKLVALGNLRREQRNDSKEQWGTRPHWCISCPQDCSSSQQRAFDNTHVFVGLWIECSKGLSESAPFKLKTNCSLVLNTYLGQSLFLAASPSFSDYFLCLLGLQTSPRGLSSCRTDVQLSTRPPHPPCHFTRLRIFLTLYLSH